MSDVMGIAKFERLFREAAGLDVDKSDLRRLVELINRKLHDLLVMGEAAAKFNERDVVRPPDLPVTKGLQENMHAYRELEADLELSPILEQLATLPPLDLPYDDDVERQLPELAGGLTVALARTFRTLDPDLKNPDSGHWDRALAVFDQLL